MYIIGITGGTGAGKSSAVNVLKALGASALDCDAIYHEILLTNTDMKMEIESQFTGVSIGSEISREKLSEIVWTHPGSLSKLNEITHKYMDIEIDKCINTLRQKKIKVAVIDAIALIESGQNKRCNITVGIVAPKEKRLLRIVQRDNITEENALKRINAQQPESFYYEKCDHIIVNSFRTESVFEAKCRDYFEELLSENIS